MILYYLGMREEELRRYFQDEVNVSELTLDLQGSVVQVDDLSSIIRIADMQETFLLARQHVIKLCNAFQERALNADELSTIAFALLASDAFEWDDEVISEVLSDWSAPEINFVLNDETMSMHRGWLLGTSDPPLRSMVGLPDATNARLISIRTKTAS